MLGVFDHIHQTFQNYMLPRLSQVAKADSIHDVDLKLLLGTLKTTIGPKVVKIFNEMASELESQPSSKAVAELIGIDPNNLGISHVLDHFRDENVRLVEDAGRDYAEQVRDIFTRLESNQLRVEELKKELLERADVSRSRAELIARDQVLKLNGQINQTRQTKAGVTQYRWSTSKDERVRSRHAELEGQVFDWSQPPQAGANGEELHPGADYQCRCIGVPIIEGLEGI